MTDITELMQSLKAAADSVIKYYDNEWFEAGHQICTVHKSKINLISLANPANILALVEALELIASQGQILLHQDESLAIRRGELESRTITVENMQESAYRAGLTAGWNLGLANNNDGFNKCLAAHAEGINGFHLLKVAENNEIDARCHIVELEEICAEAYQVVGILADKAGVFETSVAVSKVLDNLSETKMIHKDILPFSLDEEVALDFKQNKLRELVDLVWNTATESTEVPSTKWADELITKVFGVYKNDN